MNDSVMSYVSKTPESLIRAIPVFIVLFIMLLTIPTIYNCNGGCSDEEDPTESHAVILTSHPINES